MTNTNWLEAEIGNPNEFVPGLMKERTPEKASALQAVIDNHHITFQFDETEERVFYTSHTQSGRVRIGLSCSTRLMAHSFAYLSANFAQIEKVKNIALGLPIPQDYDERLRAASELLTWAVTHDVKCKLPAHARELVPDHLPDDLVQLLQQCLQSRHHDAAGELFANALVWILYHEVVHIQNGDGKCDGFESIEQEKLADRMAADWMLDSAEIDPIDQWKRQVGIAIALGWLTAPTIYLGPEAMTTHPHAYNRLFQVIDRVVEPEQVDVWMFVQMVLVLHVLNRKLAVDSDRMGANCRDNCNYLIDLISKLPSR